MSCYSPVASIYDCDGKTINKTAIAGDSFNFTCEQTNYCSRPDSFCWGLEWTFELNRNHTGKVYRCPKSTICYHHPINPDKITEKPESILMFTNITSNDTGKYTCTEYDEYMGSPSSRVSLRMVVWITVKEEIATTSQIDGKIIILNSLLLILPCIYAYLSTVLLENLNSN